MTTTLRSLQDFQLDLQREANDESTSRARAWRDGVRYAAGLLKDHLDAALADDQSPEPGEGGGVRCWTLLSNLYLPKGRTFKRLNVLRRTIEPRESLPLNAVGLTDQAARDLVPDDWPEGRAALEKLLAEPEPLKPARPHDDDPDFYSKVNEAQRHLKERLRMQDCDADALLEYITRLEASLYAVPVAPEPEPVKAGELRPCPQCGGKVVPMEGRHAHIATCAGDCQYWAYTRDHLHSRPAEGEKCGEQFGKPYPRNCVLEKGHEGFHDHKPPPVEESADPRENAQPDKPTPATGPTQAAPTNTYQRLIKGCLKVDVYDVLRAFNVTDPAIAHAAKKLLCAGQRRGDKTQQQDYDEAIESIKRAAIRQPGGP